MLCCLLTGHLDLESVVNKKELNKNNDSVLYYLCADTTATRPITQKTKEHKKNKKHKQQRKTYMKVIKITPKEKQHKYRNNCFKNL